MEIFRREAYKYKLTLFYKIFSNLSPSYLSSLVPQPVNAASAYNLRNQKIFKACSHVLTIRDWSNIPLDTRNSGSIETFKRKLNHDATYVPKYYFTGNRKLQVLHTRLRTNCSSLHHDRFQ